MDPDTAARTRTDARLLVVDDHEDNRYILTQRLRREGYRNIVQATNGVEAMFLLSTSDIDLVLLDVLMPEMDGYQVLAQIRGNARLRYIDVMMFL